MIKRILSLILCVSLFVTVFPVFACAADGGRKTSEEGLAMIKRFEGFISMPMADGGQWAIGYGNKCNPGDYPNGITEAEADALLRETLTYFEDYLNRKLSSWGVSVSQHQYDALVSITYNLGVAWINSSYRFWTMLRNGLDNYTNNQIASALGVWCHVGSSVSTGVLQRRITEIRLFLHGDYTGTQSPNYRYVIFNGNGGSIDTDIMVYQEDAAYTEFPGATKNGVYFAGWYTEKSGGTQVTEQDIAEENLRLYAHWSQTPVESKPVESIPEENAPVLQDGTYTDVHENDWFYEYVMDLSDAGVIDGFDDGTYRPSQSVTAAQALKLVILACGYTEQAPVSSHWASGYLQLALDEDWIDKADMEDPEQPISREVLAKLAANALQLGASDGESPFADAEDGYVVALYEAGILEGSIDAATGDRMYYPQKSLKRSEIAKIIWMIR